MEIYKFANLRRCDKMEVLRKMNRLKEVRLEAGILQGELAEEIGYTQNYFSLVENSHKVCGKEFLDKVSEKLGIPTYKLIPDAHYKHYGSRPEWDEMAVEETRQRKMITVYV